MAKSNKSKSKPKSQPKEKLTPEKQYRNLLTQRVKVNQRVSEIRTEHAKLQERNLAIEGGLQTLEQGHGFDRQKIGKEVMEELGVE